MQLQLSDDQEFLRETTRRFIENDMPLQSVRDLYDNPAGFDRAWWTRAAELGWTTMFVPEAQGGGSLGGRPTSDSVIFSEEIGRMVSPGPFLPLNLVALAIGRDGSEEQRNEHLPGIVSGESIIGWAFGEAGDEWDPECLQTALFINGDDLVVNGAKAYVEAATSADHFLVTARSDDGLTQVLVPADASGVAVTGGRSVDMTRRFGRVEFDNVRISKGAVVGVLGGAASSVNAQLALGIALQCAAIIGASERVLETTMEYGRERVAFGRPILSFQEPKHRVAALFTHLEGMKAIGEALTHAVDAGDIGAYRLAAVAKAYVSDHGLDIVDECVQITGGLGVTWEHDIHMYNRRVLVDHAMLGNPDHHRQRLFAMLQEEMS